MRVTINCPAEIVDVIDAEARGMGMSRTRYLSQVLHQLFEASNVLTEGTHLDELEASARVLNDDVIAQIPPLARSARRNLEQMILYLIEAGIKVQEENSVPNRGAMLKLVKPSA